MMRARSTLLIIAPLTLTLLLAVLSVGCSVFGPSAQNISNQTAIAGIQASLDALNGQSTATQVARVTAAAQSTQNAETTGTARAGGSATAVANVTATARQSLSEANAPAGWRLTFYDPFEDNRKGWSEGKDDNEFNHSDLRIDQGKYLWTAKAVQGFVHWERPSNISRSLDFYVTVDGRLESGEPSTGYGIIVRYNQGDFYEFVITEQGSWDISVIKKDVWNWLKGGQSGQIVAGGNHLTVKGVDDNYIFYVNGAEIARITDDRVSGDGSAVGLIIEMNFRGAEATVSFDNFTVLVP